MKTFKTAAALMTELRRRSDPKIAKLHQRFFRTGPGEYGEGDRFLGLKVPVIRQIARTGRELPETEIAKLLKSPWHEARHAAAILLAEKSSKAKTPAERKRLAGFYWKNRAGINNWDLVDVSAPTVLGSWLKDVWEDDPTAVSKWVLKHVRSQKLWERRLAVLATFALIRMKEPGPTLRACEACLNDKEDLMHKATGWMLREVGQRNPEALEEFLDAHASRMPRTMLRYSIEKLSPSERKLWMEKKAK